MNSILKMYKQQSQVAQNNLTSVELEKFWCCVDMWRYSKAISLEHSASKAIKEEQNCKYKV